MLDLFLNKKKIMKGDIISKQVLNNSSITVRMPKALRDELESVISDKEVTLPQVVRALMRDYIKKQKADKGILGVR